MIYKMNIKNPDCWFIKILIYFPTDFFMVTLPLTLGQCDNNIFDSTVQIWIWLFKQLLSLTCFSNLWLTLYIGPAFIYERDSRQFTNPALYISDNCINIYYSLNILNFCFRQTNEFPFWKYLLTSTLTMNMF